ncbi:DUF6777 domain-containing protein [Streptomyces sp. GbtcB6]|uniref:DUF6777 domain-containing protein n=1 Tax=Streptomyces sp. GbtcB6 TaxID=2824751 RepID=UPI0027E556E9|nr:DUF6777 domain-containing protein [Streptomyces sp. GbtcB6]
MLVVLVPLLVLGGCGRASPRSAVEAVAAGVSTLNPFVDEHQGVGHDVQVRSLPVRGHIQQGDSPGLYGGTREPTICDVEKLKEFLTDPANHRKAQAWAGVLHITTAQIPGYLDRLTPVLLRHDTLVENHDYKDGTATPFNSLLQAGIAVLVDRRGQPTVKCSCGNPLLPFKDDPGHVKVEFRHGNKKWTGYDRDEVTTVRPTARPLEQLALVDVTDPARGIERPMGTEGARDTVFRTGDRHAVPEVAGTSFGEASRLLADAGLAAASDGPELPPDDARVLGSDPVAGTRLAFGEYVTLRVAEGSGGGADGGGSPSGSGGGEGPDGPSVSSSASSGSVGGDSGSSSSSPSSSASSSPSGDSSPVVSPSPSSSSAPTSSSSSSSFMSPSSVSSDTSSEPATDPVTPSGAAAAPSSSPAPSEPPPVTQTAGGGPTSDVPVPDDGAGTGTA